MHSRVQRDEEIAKDNFHYVFERSEAGGLGACPHERKKRGDAPLALRGPLPWRPVLFSEISTNAPSVPLKEKKRKARCGSGYLDEARDLMR
jgi:hypothetical protein